MHNRSFEVPILIIAWRRPDHLSKVIDAIRVVKPKQLFIAIDGPRKEEEFAFEREQIEKSKQVVEQEINWNCTVTKLYRDVNLGCAKGVSTAITWFFEQVDQGIIIEDDIIITKAGLEFFEWGLHRFKENKKVWMLSAWNPYKTYNISIIQNYFYCWGWATWKRTWQQYSLEISNSSMEYSSIRRVNNYWKNIFSKVEEIDTWDYSLQYWMFKHKVKAVLAPKNYVDNIGFDAMGVHTTESKPEELKIPLSYSFTPPKVLNMSRFLSDLFDYERLRN